MRHIIPVAGAWVLLTAAVAYGGSPGRPDPSLIETVDRTFQSRFETIDGKMFGVERAAQTLRPPRRRRGQGAPAVAAGFLPPEIHLQRRSPVGSEPRCNYDDASPFTTGQTKLGRHNFVTAQNSSHVNCPRSAS
jgi:hypothetical protein